MAGQHVVDGRTGFRTVCALDSVDAFLPVLGGPGVAVQENGEEALAEWGEAMAGKVSVGVSGDESVAVE